MCMSHDSPQRVMLISPRRHSALSLSGERANQLLRAHTTASHSVKNMDTDLTKHGPILDIL